MLPATLQFLITMIACAINERMQRKLNYTQEEVRVLKEILAALTGSGRISFTADQRSCGSGHLGLLRVQVHHIENR
jgi:hypothetical protein